jgi:hypothetical protein
MTADVRRTAIHHANGGSSVESANYRDSVKRPQKEWTSSSA